MSDFVRLQEAFIRLPKLSGLSKEFQDRSCEQLRRAVLAAYSDDEKVGSGDLAGLVRHVLRRSSLMHTDSDFLLHVPRMHPWPSKSMWEDSHVDIVGSDQKTYRVKANKDWTASWLAGSVKAPPLLASYREEFRREGWPSSPYLPFDTALEFGLELPFPGYQGPGQRLAIRSAFFLKPGGTLVVNLPTGTGKSLVAWAPALLGNENDLTVMITPTIALAIDQEKQLQSQYKSISDHLPPEMAWHSGLSEEGRKMILARLRQGTQRILITSPESFVGILSRYMFETASKGCLKYFVVDEAHLVSQWGNDFRPEFQAMAGMRRALLQQCPSGSEFRTLLLSATLPQESFDVLESLFSDGLFDSINAVSLRPEPEYWISPSHDNIERKRKVIELARIVPRPFLLYVTKKEDAKYWYRELGELEIKRCGCVHGNTPNKERESVINRWRSGDIDCVVATSAFGLGMDKSDVRTVIHACIPESIDRFYQEVGRTGRDGDASVSFLLPCEVADRKTADSINQNSIISLELGLRRWESMILSKNARKLENSEIWSVDLNTRLSHIKQDSDENAAWNLRTLVLLNRAGIIRLESTVPPIIERNEHETNQDFENRRQEEMASYFTTAHLRILNEGHLSLTTWQSTVSDERNRINEASRQTLQRMNALLQGNYEVGKLLQETYSTQTTNGGGFPDLSCSGCPKCRQSGVEISHRFSHPEPDLVSCIEHTCIDRLRSLFSVQTDVVFVRCPSEVTQRKLIRKYLQLYLQKLVEYGIDEFAVPDAWRKQKDWKRLHEGSNRRFIVSSPLRSYDQCRNDLRLPRATFLLDETDPTISQSLITMERPFHIIFAPEQSLEHNSRRRFFDRQPHMLIHEFARRLGQ